ncbi:MAG: OmpA family protein [Myxococcales bacterium]|nr:OmpA family protein [Myxococcales bacterium]
MDRLGAWLVIACLTFGCGAAVTTAVPDEGAPPPPLEVVLRSNRIVFNRPILFAHDSDQILDESFEVLDRVAAIMGQHPSLIRLQVQGHSSIDGSTSHNQDLSARRAAAVAAYLREAGVAQEITSQGYGETYPLCHEDTDDCHARNRRVEFFVDER